MTIVIGVFILTPECQTFINTHISALCVKEVIVFSVGGSLINPGTIDIAFLKKLKNLFLSSNRKFVVVCGGGHPARNYMTALSKFTKNSDILDQMGIECTALNAHLFMAVMGKHAEKKVHRAPKKMRFKKCVVGCGWKPGCSSDLDAVLWAIKLKATKVINLTNTDYVYDKDPRKSKNAKPLKQLSWSNYLKLIGKWKSGLNSPFDPIASKLAKKSGIKVYTINGKKLSQVKNAINNKSFIGTVLG